MTAFPWLTGEEETRFVTRDGREHRLPVFLPVFERKASLFSLQEHLDLGARGFIVNAFFLYRERAVRESFLKGDETIANYLGLPPDHDCLLMTDSGAYQGFRQRVLLKNTKIIAFQDKAGVDISSPLDLVSNPADNQTESKHKAEVTLKRIRQGIPYAERSILAGVQQGGRFRHLRAWCLEELLAMGLRYIAIGSLVPFFTAKHDISVAFDVIRDARRIAGNNVPLHVFGSGDPLEIPFFAACGANVFDSSSFAHYALKGNYMTPYGALQDPGVLQAGEWKCTCPVCAKTEDIAMLKDTPPDLARHNLAVILQTVETLKKVLAEERLPDYLNDIVALHRQWFPESRLPDSWTALQEEGLPG